jgi:hypothetical protein
MVSKNIKGMIDREKIEMELIKLKSGERLLRLTEPRSGLSLERKLNPDRPVTDQKKQLLSVFEAALTRAELSPA